jgi:hypothetical protein
LGDWQWLSPGNAHDQPLCVVYILSLLKNSPIGAAEVLADLLRCSL